MTPVRPLSPLPFPTNQTNDIAVPAFLTLIIIPLTYNIAYGVIAGIISFVLINGIAWLLRKVSGERLAPPNYDASEPWVIPPGSIVPTWMRFVAGRVGLGDDADRGAHHGHHRGSTGQHDTIEMHLTRDGASSVDDGMKHASEGHVIEKED